MPAAFKELRRHESSDTTMRFYVAATAQRTNNVIWASFKQEQESWRAMLRARLPSGSRHQSPLTAM